MVVNSSRILTLDQKMPQAQVSNPDVLELTPLSATQVQVLAKKAGVTQVNLWDEKENIHTVDVIVYGDTRELSMLLQSQFPTTSLKVVPTANSVIVSGHVDDPQQISRIIQIAEDFYPKVINNITVAGVQQVLLKVKVMEVSRTKIRRMGFDFKYISGNDFLQSSISGLLQKVAISTGAITTTGNETLSFGILGDNSAFFGFLEALRKENLATILAEPNLTAYSGRPASFNAGGEFPILVPQSLGTVSVQYKKFGTEVDFVPIVLGTGAIRLEVKPRVSEIDDTRSVTVNGINVPGLKVREANTGVEMRAGQTLALAGLVQTRRNYEKRAVPWIGELPYVGALFRNVKAQDDEVELLVLVTPQLVEALDPCDVPPGGPGLQTSSPNDCQLYLKGHIEVPRCPVDDECAPSRSPGSAYEYGVPPAGAGGDIMGPPGVPGVVPQREVIVPGEQVPDSGPAIDPQARRRPAPVVRPAVLPPRTASDSARTSRYDRSSPSRATGRTASASQGVAKPPQASPGFIGPVGYDVRK